MKTLEKAEMLERNKVMRVLTEARILSAVDHPFLASLYGTITTDTHLHFLMQICEGGELYALLTSQPSKRFKESHARFYTAEVRCPPGPLGLPCSQSHLADKRQACINLLCTFTAQMWATQACITDHSKVLPQPRAAADRSQLLIALQQRSPISKGCLQALSACRCS